MASFERWFLRLFVIFTLWHAVSSEDEIHRAKSVAEEAGAVADDALKEAKEAKDEVAALRDALASRHR